MANKFKMASRFAAAACYPTPGPLFHKETTVYYHETNILNAGDVAINPPPADGNTVTIVQLSFPNATADQIRSILADRHVKDLQIIGRESITTTRDGGEGEDNLGIDLDPESGRSVMSNPPTGSNVNADEVISQLNDKSDNTVNVEVTRRISDNDQVVQCLTVRVTKWKMVKPFCRFNTVVLVIFLFLSIATAIFILFYKYVLQKQP